MRHPTLGAVLCGLGLLGTSAVSHGQANNGWALVEQSTSCAMLMEQPDGTLVAFRVPKSSGDSVNLLLGNSSWRSLADRKRVRLSIYLNGRPQLLKPVSVQAREGRYWISIPVSRKFVAQIFKQSITIAIEYERNMIALLPSLAWAESTYIATERCAGVASDPFAN